jgi:hypothetical protein
MALQKGTRRFLTIIVVVLVALGVFLYVQKPSFSLPTMGTPALTATDFEGTWYNSNLHFDSVLAAVRIDNNQGTYTINALQLCSPLDGELCSWGTTVLTVTVPNAHAFYTFTYGSADLQLQLQNATSLKITESVHSDRFGSTTVRTEEFVKPASTTISQAVGGGIQEMLDVLMRHSPVFG